MFEVPAGAKGWLVIFHTRSARWVERVCPGRFKHVSMVGFVPEAAIWLALSWELGRLRVCVIPDAEFTAWLGPWAGPDAAILRCPAPVFDVAPWRPRLGLFCVPMVAHVLGLRGGALLPMTLWRLLLANGAEIVEDGRPVSAEGSADQPAVGAGSGVAAAR